MRVLDHGRETRKYKSHYSTTIVCENKKYLLRSVLSDSLNFLLEVKRGELIEYEDWDFLLTGSKKSRRSTRGSGSNKSGERRGGEYP